MGKHNSSVSIETAKKQAQDFLDFSSQLADEELEAGYGEPGIIRYRYNLFNKQFVYGNAVLHSTYLNIVSLRTDEVAVKLKPKLIRSLAYANTLPAKDKEDIIVAISMLALDYDPAKYCEIILSVISKYKELMSSKALYAQKMIELRQGLKNTGGFVGCSVGDLDVLLITFNS